MSAAEAGRVETPSGKGAAEENFPVGSFLIARRLRPHVARYYAFARAIDDIADNPDLAPDEKVRRLDAMDRALQGEPGFAGAGFAKARALRETLIETGVDFAHASDLVSAFKQDAVKGRYEDWDDLIDYCNRSASPVGRFLLELHGEDRAGFAQSDALCNALQVINHLQDCAQDHARLDRVYLPGDWMAAEGADVAMLKRPAAPAPLRAVLDRCIAATRELMREADRLPGRLKSFRLAMESGVIVKVAWRLLDELSARDPLAERIELTKPQFLASAGGGLVMALMPEGARRERP